MTVQLNNIISENQTTNDEEYNNPLDISDILQICYEYNKLGWSIQGQVEHILELGLQEAIHQGYVKINSLSHIKQFLKCIKDNFLFGDASDQAADCLKLIQQYEEQHRIFFDTPHN